MFFRFNFLLKIDDFFKSLGFEVSKWAANFNSGKHKLDECPHAFPGHISFEQA